MSPLLGVSCRRKIVVGTVLEAGSLDNRARYKSTSALIEPTVHHLLLWLGIVVSVLPSSPWP